MGHDITLHFGKHKGKMLSQIPLDYVLWLAENAREQHVKDASHAYLVESGNSDVFERSARHTGKYASAYFRTWYSEDELEEREQDERREDEEYLEEFDVLTLRWTAQSGAHIVIRSTLLPDTVERGFEVTVDSRTTYHAENEIVEVSNVPDIVAKIGRVGLTQERREALLAMIREK